MAAITEFTINLTSAQLVFYPGQTVEGNLVLRLKDPLAINTINVKLSGKECCNWQEVENIGKKKVTHTYKGKENIIKETQCLFNVDNRQSSTSTPGVTKYEFSFHLAEGLPSSFEGNHGYIRYLLKATIEVPNHSYTVRRPITVNDIIDTNSPDYANGESGEIYAEIKNSKIGLICFKNEEHFRVRSSISRRCYCPGEAILINADVQNNTASVIKFLKTELIQVAIYHSKQKNKAVVKQIAELNGPFILKGKKASWVNQPLGVPATSPTIANTKIVTVHYFLNVMVDTPEGVDTEPIIKMYITMGTVPYVPTYGESVNYGTPEDPQGPPEANFIYGSSYTPPEPSVYGYPEMYPPSYSASLGEKKVNIGKEKDFNTGELLYIPVYTFAQPYKGSHDWVSAPKGRFIPVQPAPDTCAEE